jgi:hypothetical protein
MYPNITRTGEEPGETGCQGPLCFHVDNPLVSCSFDVNGTLKYHLATVSRYTISQAVPHLVKLFLDPDEVSNRAPIIVLLAELIVAARDSMAKSPAGLELGIPLTLFKDEVLGVFTVGLKATSSCQPALAGLKAMVTTPNLLINEELAFIVHSVGDLLQADPDDGDAARSVKSLENE